MKLLLSLLLVAFARALVPAREVRSSVVRAPVRGAVSMRYGHTQVLLRTRIKKLISTASDIEAVADVMASPYLAKTNWRLRARMLYRLRRKAYSMGYEVGEVGDKKDKASKVKTVSGALAAQKGALDKAGALLGAAANAVDAHVDAQVADGAVAAE